MIKLILSLLLALATTASASSAYTNLPGGIGVGNVGDSTYAVITGVASVKHELPLTSLWSDSYLPIVSASAVTTAMYIGQATGLTNHAAVFFPSQPASLVGVVQFRVPDNYRSDGTLYALVHTSGAVTANGISVTADVYYNDPNSATVTTKAAGTVVNFPTSAETQIRALALTNSNITFSPGRLVTYKLTVAGTDAVTRQVLGLYFQYRPWNLAR